jgi:hypothetical protein
METSILTCNTELKARQGLEDISSILDEPLLDRKAAAKYLGLKNPNTLAVWDCTKRYDLRPIKVGNRVRYTRANLIRFLNSQLSEK